MKQNGIILTVKEGLWQEPFEAVKWYEDEVYGLCDGFLEMLNEVIIEICKQPKANAVIAKGSYIRRMMMERFSHKVYYSNKHPQINILAVIHKSR